MGLCRAWSAQGVCEPVPTERVRVERPGGEAYRVASLYLEANEGETEYVLNRVMVAMDARTGETLWQTRIEGVGINHQDHKQSQNNLTAAYYQGKVFSVGSTPRGG